MDSWFPTFRRWADREIPLPAIWPRAASAAQRQALLRLISLATEENVPLWPLLEQWAQDERGLQQRRVRRLSRALKSGKPLAEALEEVPGILGDEDLLAIRFDAQMGTRTAAVRQMIGDPTPGAASDPHHARGALVYFATVVIVGFLLIAFVQLKIVPVFDRMFQEFGYQRPQSLLWSVAIARTIAGFWWLIPVALFVGIWCMLSTQTGRFIRNSVFSRLFQPMRELHSADVLKKLGLATAEGRPIPSALSTLARYHFVPDVRHKLLFVRNEVELGAETWNSMAAVGLLSPPELRLLKTAERIGNRPWVLKQLAAVKERRTRFRLERAAMLMLPAVVLLLACIVIFQALTIMVPLVKLIEGNL
jgi:type II secretory pathway component PulF